jgi:hypothetical protein
MSRLWDTPEFWARSEADDILREMSNVAPDVLADSLEQSAANDDGDPEMVELIVADLRHRAAAGVRFWPLSQAMAEAPALPDALTDDDIPW